MKTVRAVVGLTLPLLVIAAPAMAAEAWVATHTLYRGATVHSDDIAPQSFVRLPFHAVPADQSIVGLEVKASIYAGRAVTERDVGPPSLVKVNTMVDVVWKANGIVLELRGRALESGAKGDDIRVLNTATSRTIHGTVVGDGIVEVQNVP